MSALQETFLSCLAYIVVGQLVRLLSLKTPEQLRSVAFMTKLVIQVTLPCLLLRTMSRLRSFPFDAVLLMLLYVAYNVIAAVVGVVVYHRRPVEDGAGLAASLLGMNVGVFFYPIMEQIAGEPGVARLAMYDTANEIFVFLVYPWIFEWAGSRYKRKLAAAAAAKEASGDSNVAKNAVELESVEHAEHTDHADHGDSRESMEVPVHDPRPVVLVPAHQLQSPTPTPSPCPPAYTETPDVHVHLTDSHKSNNTSSTTTTTTTATTGKNKKSKKSKKNKETKETQEATQVIEETTPTTTDGNERLPSVSPGLTAQWDVDARVPSAPLPSEKKQRKHLARARGARRRAHVWLHETRAGRRVLTAVRVVWKIVSVLPLDAIVIGLAVGIGGQRGLPAFIDGVLLKAANANTVLGMVLLGMMLDLSPRRLLANLKDTAVAVLLRYAVAAVCTCAFYFGVGPAAESDLTRLVFAVGLFMPAPIVCGAFALEHGLNPNVEALIINVTMILSFFIIWIIMLFVPLPGNSSSSFSFSDSSLSM